VRFEVGERAEAAFQRHFRERVAPALAQVEGCRFAALLTPWRADGYRSVTLWSSEREARAYEQSALYRELLRSTEPFLAERTVWRVRLAEDPLETLGPEQRELPSDGYQLESTTAPDELDRLAPGIHVRLVAIHVQPGKREELAKLYREAVLPTLRATRGCLGAFLAEAARNPDEALSVTLWEREEDAVRYEMSGEFDRLTRRLQGILSPGAGWQVTLGAGDPERFAGPSVSTFQLAQARRSDPQTGDS
jgi:heme-degrading monooxygenase HmoA